MSVPLLQQMRQLQVKAMDVHHIMANGSMARQADLEGVTGEIYWHEGLGGPYAEFARDVLKQADIKLFDYLWTMGRIDAYLVMVQAIERAGAVDREKVATELRKPGAMWKQSAASFSSTTAACRRSSPTPTRCKRANRSWCGQPHKPTAR